ncbi:MAG: hypothetical protein U0Z75_06910 [Deinococcaceae bacterium]
MKSYTRLTALTLSLGLMLAACGQKDVSSVQSQGGKTIDQIMAAPVSTLTPAELDFRKLRESLKGDLKKLSPEMARTVLGQRQQLSASANEDIRIATMSLFGKETMVPMMAAPMPDVSAETLLAKLNALGFQGGVMTATQVAGSLPVSQLDAMSKLNELAFARKTKSITNSGRVTTQGHALMKTDKAIADYKTTGATMASPVKVGVISDSFNNIDPEFPMPMSTYKEDLVYRDLPSGTTILAEGLGGEGSGLTDEGRAMAQIISDIAPGASILFAAGQPNDKSVYKAIIQMLADKNVNVIVDDITFLAEPFFENGDIAQKVASVVSGKKTVGTGKALAYFVAAGNTGAQSYDGAFSPVSFGMNTFHDFNDSPTATDPCQKITIPAGESIDITLQWDDNFFSVSGGTGSTHNIDAFFSSTASCAAVGGPQELLSDGTRDVINGTGVDESGMDPMVNLQYKNLTGSSQTVGLAIQAVKGSAPRIKYILFGNGSINNYKTNSSTIFGAANSESAFTVGAADWTTVNPTTFAFTAQPTTAVGGTPILFNADGSRKATAFVPPKPDMVGPDGVNTTFFGTDTDGDGWPNFHGTSAAVSHVGGVAALAISATTAKMVVPTLIPAQVVNLYAALRGAGSNATHNYTSGYGFINGYKAICLYKGGLTC